MTGGALISEVLRDEEGIDPNDVFYAELRAEVLARIQERADDLWVDYDWPWKKAHLTTTVTGGVGNGVGPLPATFQSFGHQMTVTVNGQPRFKPLGWRPLGDLVAERSRLTGTAAAPGSFSIALESTAGVKSIFVSPFVGQDTVLNIVFDKVTPTILDSTVPPTGLEEWPVTMHRAVLKCFGVQEMMRKKGDIRAETSYQKKIDSQVAHALRAEMPGRGAIQRMPPHPAARRFYR